MTRAKRDGIDQDFCAAIMVKRKLFKLRAFTRWLPSTNLFLSPSALSSLSRPSVFFFILFCHSSPFPSIPILASDTFSSRAFALFIVSVSFQAFRTVYKMEALNWKPRLCRRYCGFFFLPFRFRPVCCLSLLLLAFFTSALFVSTALENRYSCTPSREGSPWRREDRPPLQLTLGPDLLNVLFLRQPYFHRLQLNLQSRKTSLKPRPSTKHHFSFSQGVWRCPGE